MPTFLPFIHGGYPKAVEVVDEKTTPSTPPWYSRIAAAAKGPIAPPADETTTAAPGRGLGRVYPGLPMPHVVLPTVQVSQLC